jgi:hypothetical protein
MYDPSTYVERLNSDHREAQSTRSTCRGIDYCGQIKLILRNGKFGSRVPRSIGVIARNTLLPRIVPSVAGGG